MRLLLHLMPPLAARCMPCSRQSAASPIGDHHQPTPSSLHATQTTNTSPRAELERVESTGAWVVDGRVCNVLAVSRAFGDPEFKGPGLRTLLAEGARKGMWSQEFADTHTFTSDPVIVEPDVTEVRFEAGDEFLLMATDGLWDCMPPADAVAYARKQFRNGKNAQAVAEAMTAIAVKRYTADNVACVVVDLRRGGGGSGGSGGSSSNGSSGGGKGGGFFGGLFGGR